MIAGRSTDKGQAIAERLGENAYYVNADVTIERDIKAAIDDAVERFGKLDILFNNAGGPIGGNLESVTEEDFDKGVRLILGSVIFGMKHAIPLLKANGGGSIINNSSIAPRH